MTTSDSRFVLASKLAQFLRRNGDKVINGSSKLSLTTSALCLLNSLFIDVFQQDVFTNDNSSYSSSVEVQEDVKYLYDFMKKTTSLKLFHGMQTLRGGVDLSHFTNLTVLELRKIPTHLIIGLNSLSFQLKALICSRSIYLLKELFGYSVDDQNISDVWTDLKELNVSYNYLESLDSSLKNIPNVEILDLSHNNIRNTEEIQILKLLHCVNLSYNQLDTLPVFSSSSCRFMLKLYIRNNHLENLDGLECLFNLEELDVSYNLLSEYFVLNPLDKLKSLKMLNLEGNPLFFHKQHFRLVCNFIHPFALNRGLYLNGKFIAIPQDIHTLVKDDEFNAGRHQTSLNTVVGDMQNVIPAPEIRPQKLKGVSSIISITSDRSFSDENCASSYTSQKSLDETLAVGTKPKKKNKSRDKKGRIVVISDAQEESEESKKTEFLTLENNEIQRHMLVKEIYESRREERGESWLIPDNPLNLEKNLKVPTNTPVVRSDNVLSFHDNPRDQKVPTNTPVYRSDNKPVMHAINIISNENSINEKDFSTIHKTLSSTPIDSELQEILDIQNEPISDTDSDRKRHISKESDDIEVLASNLQGSSSSEHINVNSEDLSDGDFYKSSAHYSADDSLSECEDESEDSIFCVERVDNIKSMEAKTVFIKIGPKCAKEKDVITGKHLDTLDLSTLVSVRKVVSSGMLENDLKKYEIHLDFDAIKTSRQKRVYIFQDLASADRLCKILQPFADASTLKEATLGALECMKCKSTFSKQVANRKVLKTKNPRNNIDDIPHAYDSSKGYYREVDECPNCGNDILVEMESIPLPSVAAPSKNIENSPCIAQSPGSTGSSSSGYMFANLLNSFKALSPVSKRKSVSGTANENEDKITSKTSEAIGIYQNEKRRESESHMSRNSSDVTIISNPSQSSIAVIPDPVIENSLNTITEKDSQASLSPPMSGDSTIHSVEKELKNEEKHNDNIILSTKDDPDFYSMTESFSDEKDKPFKCSDIVSNDSDVYHSPNKSVGSSNFKNLKETNATDKIMLILSEKKPVTFDSFKHLDHRLKLHIEIYIFGKDEYINCCLQTSIVPLSTGEEFEGVFLLSSENIYVIKFLSQYNTALEKSESLTKQVQVLYSGPLSQVKQIKQLLGNQGICVACGPPVHVYTLIIRDSDTCNSFCNFISEEILGKNPQFQCLTFAKEALENQYESVLACESGEKPEILLHQFAFKRDKDIVLPICTTLTKDNLYLFKVLYKKQQSCLDISEMEPYFFAKYDCQKISDVISLKLDDHFTVVEICFLIEASNADSLSWTIEMPTRSAMFSFISALKSPWEDIFGVPLLIDVTKNSS